MKSRYAAAIALLVLLALFSLAGRTRPAQADDPAWYDGFTEVTLHDLQANPTSFKTAKVRFKAFFNKVESIFTPFYTPFIPEQYLAFSIWAHDRNLWVKSDRMADFPFCFVRKDSAYVGPITTTKKYGAFELFCTVENDFNNTPWLQVVHVRALEGRRLTDKSLHHMVVGYEYLAAGQSELAEHEFWEAQKYDLPDHARLAVLSEVAKIAFEARRYKEAEEYAHQILGLDHNNQLGQDLYRAAREEMVRAYNGAAPHGIEGPSGTDNSHVVPRQDDRGRRSSEAPKDRAAGPAVAEAQPVQAAQPANLTLLAAQARIGELEKLLNARDKTLADRSAALADREAELIRIRQEREQQIAEQSRYTAEVKSVREQLASLQVERGRMEDGKVATTDTLKQEILALETRKSELSQLTAGRDELVQQMMKQGQDLATCKIEMAGLMAQREAVTHEIEARRAEVANLATRKDGMAGELSQRQAELAAALAAGTSRVEALNQEIAAHESRAQSLTQTVTERESAASELAATISARQAELKAVATQVQELEARKREVESLVARAGDRARTGEELTQTLATRQAELDGVLARRAELTRELEARAAALRQAETEVTQTLAQRDALCAELAAASRTLSEKQAEIARVAEPKEAPTAQDPNLAANLAEIAARQDLLVEETSRLRKELQARDREITGLRRDLIARDGRIADLERDLAVRTSRINALESELSRVRGVAERQSALIHEAGQKIDELQARLEASARSAEVTPAPTAEAEPVWRGRRTPLGRRSPAEATR